MSEALTIISNEHRGMWRLTVALEELRKGFADPTEKPDPEIFVLIIDYIEQYIERIHQPKEEQFLYLAVRRRSQEGDAMLTQLELDHANSPPIVARLRQQLDRITHHYPEGVTEFQTTLHDYVNLMRRHIMMEEGKLFPLARKVLTAEDWEEVNQAFAEDDPGYGEHAQAEFRALMSRIVNAAPAPMGLGLSPKNAPKIEVPAETVLLEIEGLSSHYGKIQALREVNIKIRHGQLVALVGANGAGKTTLLRTLSGVQRSTSGKVSFEGRDITNARADRRVRMGISQVPEGRQVFGPMAVEDNLLLGAYLRTDKKAIADDLEQMYLMFPILKQKAKQAAGTLSGGQQQMLAMARALMARPRLLLLDEPSMGLAPLLVEEIFNAIINLRGQGKTIFLVEQNAKAALSIADHAYVIETGRTTISGTGEELLSNEKVKAAYLGM